MNGQAQIPPGMLIRIMESKQDTILYYEALNAAPPNDESGVIISGIIQEEFTQLELFTGLFADLFRERPELSGGAPPQIASFAAGIKHAVMNETQTYGLYGNIFFTDGSSEVRDIFLRALFYENIHATKFNYIYATLR